MADDRTTVGLPVGTKIGNYEVRERLGIGGQAIVYKCHDPTLDRDVAVKQISSHLAEDPKFVEQFRREAKILAKLGPQQPAIVTVHGLVEDQRGLFIVMEYVPGQSLETILREDTAPFDPRSTLQIVWRLAAALNAVHKAGIIHRDIKPGNIMIGEGFRAKITDFGVAATITAQASMPLGTTKYMAPELFEGGPVDGRADMYSLGFIAYEMLIGREKFNEVFADVIRDPHSEVLRWMKWHGNRLVKAPTAHEVNPGVLTPLSEIVARMIAKDPAERYGDMEELGRAIKAAIAVRAKPAGEAAGDEVVLEAEEPREQVAEEGLAAAAEGEEPAQPPGEGPATTPIPKKKLSRKTKRIMAASAAGLLIVAGVVLLVRSEMIKSGVARYRVNLFKKAGDAYKAALPPANEKAKFQEALEDFGKVQKEFAGSVEAAKASVAVHLCQAYLAVLEEDWEESSIEKDRAQEKLNDAQGKWDGSPSWPAEDFKAWISNNKNELDRFEPYVNDCRRFSGRIKLAETLTGAVDLLDNAWKQAGTGKVADRLKEVIEARRLVASAAKRSDESLRTHLVSAADVLGLAEDQMRSLGQGADREEVRAIVSEARRKIVPLARELLDRRLGEFARTHQHDGAVAAYRARVESAENVVKAEIARQRLLEDDRKKQQWTQEATRRKDAAEEAMKRARELATEGKTDETQEAMKEANKAKNTLMDLPVPGDLSERDLRELRDRRNQMLTAIETAMKDTEARIKVAAENWTRDKEFKRAIEAADLAKAKGDKGAELASLQRAARLKPDALEGLQSRINKVQLALDLDNAQQLQRDGRTREAMAALEEYLRRDPGNGVAMAALEECRGLVKWADIIQQADVDMQAKKWAEALRKLDAAAKIRLDQPVSDRIAECKYQIGMADAGRLSEEGKYGEVMAILVKLLTVKPSAAPIINARIQIEEKNVRCSELCAAGSAAMEKHQYAEARKKYVEATKIAVAAKLREQAEKGMHKATYEEWVAMGESQMQQGGHRAALAHFKNAEKHAKTEEEKQRVNGLIDAAQRAAGPEGT